MNPRYQLKIIPTSQRQIVCYLVLVIVIGVASHILLIRDYMTHVTFRSTMELDNILDLASRYLFESEDLCQVFRSKPLGNRTLLRDKDIFQIKLPKFIKKFKNPCFHKPMAKGNKKEHVDVLRCLPYFFIIGAPKSGTTDLWQKIIGHPDVVLPLDKEIMWFNRKRFGLGAMVKRREWSFESYESCFYKATRKIAARVSEIVANGTKHYYHHLITGEASADMLFDNDLWMQLPGNEGCSEPLLTNADFLKHLLPNIKIIVSVRNPTHRVYSDYIYESRYLKYNTSVEDFHQNVVDAIKKHTECLKHFTRRGCAYNQSLEQSYKARLRIGMYAIFLHDWFRIFPRHQFLIVRFEDHARNSYDTYRKLYQFLDLSKLNMNEERRIFNQQVPNARNEKEQIGEMLPETRRLLDKFYTPYNTQLSYLLRDKKYLWQ